MDGSQSVNEPDARPTMKQDLTLKFHSLPRDKAS
jgi:hypothetical protein